MSHPELFAMQGGPHLPWAMAEVIYEAYNTLYPGQTMLRLHQRGGFGWKEVEIIFSELKRRHPNVFERLSKEHKMGYVPLRPRL